MIVNDDMIKDRIRIKVALGEPSPVKNNMAPGFRLIVTDMDTGRLLPVRSLLMVVEDDPSKPIYAQMTILVDDVELDNLPAEVIVQ